MKKYLLGFAAIVLAISLSAFTAPKKNNVDAAYYWYAINGTSLGSRLGDVSGSPVQYTQGQAMAAGLTSCNDVGSIACIAGHSQSNQAGQSLPTDVSDNYIKRNTP
ncbi:MAG: hypothetical protein ABI675_20930 [Chitinophagaceae bacterium]